MLYIKYIVKILNFPQFLPVNNTDPAIIKLWYTYLWLH